MAREKISALNVVHSNSRHIEVFDFKSKEKEDHLNKEINVITEEIMRNCERLDILVAKEPAHGARRANAKYRVDQLKTDTRYVKSSYASLQALLYQRDQNARNRNNLLNMSFTTNAEASIQNELIKEKCDQNCESTSILIDRAMAQSDALGRSSRAVDDMLSQGGAMLGKYYPRIETTDKITHHYMAN